MVDFHYSVGKFELQGHYYVTIGENDLTNQLHDELNEKLYQKFKGELERWKNMLIDTNIPLNKFASNNKFFIKNVRN